MNSKKKKITLAILALLFLLTAIFIAYRWYKITHPFSYVNFTTYTLKNHEIKNPTLKLQGYKQEIFHGILSDSYLPKKISLVYSIPTPDLQVTQTKSTLPSFNEESCNQTLNTERCTLTSTQNQPYLELRGNSENSSDEIQAILLQKDSTLIRVQPLNDALFSKEEWAAIATILVNNLEPHSFDGSSYHFFDKWNI